MARLLSSRLKQKLRFVYTSLEFESFDAVVVNLISFFSSFFQEGGCPLFYAVLKYFFVATFSILVEKSSK